MVLAPPAHERLHARRSGVWQAPYDVPPELVWRRGMKSPTVTAELGARGAQPDAPPGRASRPAPGREPGLSAPPQAGPATLPHVAQLDPGLLDRLTDDVIRRVEQRMRIERQRRGL